MRRHFPPMSSILQKIPVIGESRDRKLLEDAAPHVYRQTTRADLTAYVFAPDAPAPKARPAVVFFHGGLWDTPMLAQFVPQCLHLADCGAVGIVVETRTSSKHQTTPADAIEDARAAIRWVRSQAAELGIDPTRVSASGAAGGAWLALHTALPTDKQLRPVDGVCCRPAGLVLFSAVVNTTPKSPFADRFSDPKTAKALSPSRLARTKLPPMLFFHGTADRVAPFAEVVKFRRSLRWRRNTCELIDYERADHSFFNFNVNDSYFELTTAAMCRFLTERGLLDPPLTALDDD